MDSTVIILIILCMCMISSCAASLIAYKQGYLDEIKSKLGLGSGSAAASEVGK